MVKMMIVDDSNIIRNKIERCAEDLPVNLNVVCKARDGEEAMALYEEHKPNFVTMDLTMPKLDGLSCIKRLLEKDPSIRILVVSALSDKLTALEAINLGARGFINKPFTEEELSSAIEKIVQKD